MDRPVGYGADPKITATRPLPQPATAKVKPPVKQPAKIPVKAPAKTALPKTTTPQKTNGYVGSYHPSYVPPPEPQVLPAPNVDVDNHVEIPDNIESTTLSNLIERILGELQHGENAIFGEVSVLIRAFTDNAQVLHPGEKLKCVTAVSQSGTTCHALIATPKNDEREKSRWRTLVKGPGVAGSKGRAAVSRREAIEALLEDLEKKVGKELLDGGVS